jgi:hypothetical protein
MPSQDLLDERGAWHQRIAATLFHQDRQHGDAGRARRGRRGGPVAGRAAGAGLRQAGRPAHRRSWTRCAAS